jgi:hypothetical protein
VGQFEGHIPSAAEQFAEKLNFQRPAPKGASEFKLLTASLKRCPDTKLSFSANCKAGLKTMHFTAAPKSVRENFSRPSGTRVSLPLFPALKRRAIGRCPSGAAFFYASFRQSVRKRVLTHTLKRCATQNPLPQLKRCATQNQRQRSAAPPKINDNEVLRHPKSTTTTSLSASCEAVPFQSKFKLTHYD